MPFYFNHCRQISVAICAIMFGGTDIPQIYCTLRPQKSKSCGNVWHVIISASENFCPSHCRSSVPDETIVGQISVSLTTASLKCVTFPRSLWLTSFSDRSEGRDCANNSARRDPFFSGTPFSLRTSPNFTGGRSKFNSSGGRFSRFAAAKRP